MDGPIQQCITLSVLTDEVIEYEELLRIQIFMSTFDVGNPDSIIISINDTTRKFTKKGIQAQLISELN